MVPLDGRCCRMKTKQNMMSLNIHENPKSQNINQICGILKGHDKMETTIKVFLYDYGDDEEEEEDDHHVGSNQKVKEARMMMMTMMTPKIVVMTMIAMMTMMTMMMTILTMIMVMMIMTMMMLRRRIMLEAIKS